jgi:GGDEF domain-containing protein
MGSGDLSVLAIPLRYNSQAGRVAEKTRVGVLALFKTPVRREMGDLEKHMRTLLSHALVTPRCMLRDPVTGLLTESFLREALDKQLGLWELTKGKLRGGIVIGMIDTLKLYKQTLESAGNIDPSEVSEKVSDVLRGVATCVTTRANKHELGGGEVYRSGVAGRIGREGFGVVLPLLQEQELLMWAVRLSKQVIDHHFEAEHLMDAGDITVSLRVIPFQRGTPDQLWELAERALSRIHEDQLKVRRNPEALSSLVSTIKIFKRGEWMTSREFSKVLP